MLLSVVPSSVVVPFSPFARSSSVEESLVGRVPLRLLSSKVSLSPSAGVVVMFKVVSGVVGWSVDDPLALSVVFDCHDVVEGLVMTNVVGGVVEVVVQP